MTKKIAIYPGTFDPVTFGHIDVIERASKLFDKVIVAVTTKPSKKPLFPLKQRLSLLKACTTDLPKVEAQAFSGLLVDFATKKKAGVIVRGLRQLSDFEAEFQQATVNRKLAPGIETVFIATSAKFFYLNSSIVKEIASMNGKISCFVPGPVLSALRKKFGGKKKSI